MDRTDAIRLLESLVAAGMNTRAPRANAWIEKKALQIGRCPLWVKSGRDALKFQCLLWASSGIMHRKNFINKATFAGRSERRELGHGRRYCGVL